MRRKANTMAASFNGQTPTLKYLFRAYFEDGHIIDQSFDDKSGLDSQKSAFYDVLEYEKKNPLKVFCLFNYEPGSKSFQDCYKVDLRTGLFSMNLGGAYKEFNIADQNFVPTEPLRLIYFRENRIEQNVKKESGKPDEVIEQRMYINRYFIGWQTTVDGKNVQRTIAIT